MAIGGGALPYGGGARVTLYVAEGCLLCDEALAIVESVRRDTPFALSVVDISGDEELERSYRVEIPVLEVDGERAFRFEVDEPALRALLAHSR